MRAARIALRIARMAAAAALYIALTMAGYPLAYGAVQLRFSEMLVLLCFYNADYIPAMAVGCFVVNLFSPLGMWDAAFGTLATLLAVCCMRLVKNLPLASLFPTLFCFIVALELYYLMGAPFWVTLGTVMLGEFAVVSVAGVPVCKLLERSKAFLKAIRADKRFFEKLQKTGEKEL